MPRSLTKDATSLSRSGHVTYTFPTSRSSSVITITIPRHSTWSSGLHWHEEHTEFLRVIQGIARITLGSRIFLLHPSDGTITIPRYMVHEWRRADKLPFEPYYAESKCELIVQEWTDPADGMKCLFFRNLNSVILDDAANETGSPFSRWWLDIQLLVIFHFFDNFPVYLKRPSWVRSTLTHMILSVAAVIGQVLGIRATYLEYTPDELAVNNVTTEEHYTWD